MLLVEYGPVVTAINAAPLHHYHSGQIEGSLGDSDYLCCDANPQIKQTTTTNKPSKTTTDSNPYYDSNNTTDYSYYYDSNYTSDYNNYDYGYDQQEECR